MKILTLLFFLTTFVSFAQPINRSFESASGRITLLGEATIDRLNQEPFGEWFAKNHDDYQVDEVMTVDLSKADSITIFMGTWCGDSRREVPRFIKILESVDYDLAKLKILCLNTGFQNYKQAPEREERGMNIHRVPTFVFHDADGEEVGRIVEEPVTSLEADINTVLKGEAYETAYPTAKRLIEEFEQYSMKELKKRKSKLVSELAGAKKVYELNTYGYVLWSSFQLTKAQYVFELNAEIFPDEVVVHQTLARFLNSIGENKEAMSCLKKGLQIEPENENLLAMQTYIKEEME